MDEFNSFEEDLKKHKYHKHHETLPYLTLFHKNSESANKIANCYVFLFQ